MDPSPRLRACFPCSVPCHCHHHHQCHRFCCCCCRHHHHQYFLYQFFPQHKHFNHHLHHYLSCHSHACPRFSPQPARYLEPVSSYPLPKGLNLDDTANKEASASVIQVLEEPVECVVLEEEEDDDPIFVLTDEWREFFARSEAKRKLEKQQAKNKETCK